MQLLNWQWQRCLDGNRDQCLPLVQKSRCGTETIKPVGRASLLAAEHSQEASEVLRPPDALLVGGFVRDGKHLAVELRDGIEEIDETGDEDEADVKRTYTGTESADGLSGLQKVLFEIEIRMHGSEVLSVRLQQLEPLVLDQALPDGLEIGFGLMQLGDNFIDGSLLSPMDVGAEVGLHCFERLADTIQRGLRHLLEDVKHVRHGDLLLGFACEEVTGEHDGWWWSREVGWA